MASMFFKMAAIPTNFHHISAYSGHSFTVVNLMDIQRFLGSRNPVEPWGVEQSFKHLEMHKLAHGGHFAFKNGRQSNRFSSVSLSQSSMFKCYRLDGYTQVLEVGESIGTTI